LRKVRFRFDRYGYGMDGFDKDKITFKAPVPNGMTWTIMPDREKTNRLFLSGVTVGGDWFANSSGLDSCGWASVVAKTDGEFPTNLVVQYDADQLAVALMDAHWRQFRGSRRVRLDVSGVDPKTTSKSLFLRMFHVSDGEQVSDDEEKIQSLEVGCHDMVYWCRVISRIADEMRLEVVRTGSIKWAYDYDFEFFMRSRLMDADLLATIPSYRVPAVAADLGEIVAMIFQFQYFTDFRGALSQTVANFLKAWPCGYGPLVDGAMRIIIPAEKSNVSDQTSEDLNVELSDFLKAIAPSPSA